MQRPEFEKRTGEYPDSIKYDCIEREYERQTEDGHDVWKGKDEFCAAYKENRDGLAQKIQQAADNDIWRIEENYRKALAGQNLPEEAFRRELEKGVRVNMLVAQACAHVPDPTEDEVASFYEANREMYAKDENGGAKTLVDVHDKIKDLLRHEARGRAIDIFVEELREKAVIEYK